MKTKKNVWIYPLALMGAMVFFMSSCKKEEPPVVVELPIVTTAEVTNLTATSANSGGTVVDDGGGALTASGVTWNTSTNPDLNNKLGLTNDGTAVGQFTSNITGLSPLTKYYVRAYATNSAGTSYGSEKSFTTPEPPCLTCLKDTVGNVYHFVTIGDQDWMVENLKTTKYNDGSAIPLVTGDHDWAILDTLTGGAYCYYNNDADANKDLYGAIYNYAAVRTGKLAPKGWRVPSKEDWEKLMTACGGQDIAGAKLKEVDTIPHTGAHWLGSTNAGVIGTDAFNFKGVPGGFRYARADFDAIWAGITTNALYQTTTHYETSGGNPYSYYAILWHDKASLDTPYWNMEAGCSVKCVRDHQ